MKLVFENPFKGKKNSINVFTVYYKLDKKDRPMDIVVTMTVKDFELLTGSDLAVGPVEVRRLKEAEDGYVFICRQGNICRGVPSEDGPYCQARFSRLKPFRVVNPKGIVSYHI